MPSKLIFYPDPILRAKTTEVRDFSRELQDLANHMRDVMKANNGMGLASVQVGDIRRLIIVEYPGNEDDKEPAIPFTILINPKITKTSKETFTMKEGCLSIPAVEIPIKRAKDITVLAQSVSGESLRIRAKGMFARILQHEIDHLNGVLIVDYAKHVTKSAKPIKTMIWGSTPFTTEFINTVLPNPHLHISHLVTEAPKPSGRGRELKPTIVHHYAHSLGIPCLEPEDLNDERFLRYLKAQEPELIVVAAYGKLLPASILAIPRYGCLNIHPSLLPQYRGATPIQAALLAGDTRTGVTLMSMSPQFDTGDILAQYQIKLDGNETYGDLEPLLAELGGQLFNEVLLEYINQTLEPLPQDSDLASKTKKTTREDRWLNPNDSPIINERKVRAFAPQPGAFVVLNGQIIKIVQAHLENNELIFDRVQPAGKTPMSWTEFLRGHPQTFTFDAQLPSTLA
jgi:methionyl-tRNA formyltransferase